MDPSTSQPMFKLRQLIFRCTLLAAVPFLLSLFAMSGTANATSLNIVESFSPVNGGLSPAAQAVIQSAITYYESTLKDPITVNIQFYNMTSGLGSSYFVYYNVPYTVYRGALQADASSVDDATALASLPVGTPIGTGEIGLKSATGRAVGLDTPELLLNFAGSPCPTFTGSGCIGLNVGLTTTGGGGPYSLFATVEHEIDEILGLGSAIDGTSAPSTPYAEDLFRYSAPGVRSYVASSSCPGPNAYLSINGGNTNLDAFNNCNNGGDYGDWVTHTPTQVQDAFTNGTGSPSLTLTSPETRALDVIGYDLTPAVTSAPELPTGWLLAISILLFGGLRKRLPFRRSNEV